MDVYGLVDTFAGEIVANKARVRVGGKIVVVGQVINGAMQLTEAGVSMARGELEAAVAAAATGTDAAVPATTSVETPAEPDAVQQAAALSALAQANDVAHDVGSMEPSPVKVSPEQAAAEAARESGLSLAEAVAAAAAAEAPAKPKRTRSPRKPKAEAAEVPATPAQDPSQIDLDFGD